MRSVTWPVVFALLLVFFAGCVAPENATLDDGEDTATPTDDGGREPDPSPDDTDDPEPSDTPEPDDTDDPEPSDTPTPEPEGETHTVKIGENTKGIAADYSPDTIEIKVGDKIVWDNLDSGGHTATADDGSFDTGSIGGGKKSDPVSFDSVGTFSYYCAFHKSTMNGAEVKVTE